MISFDWKNDTDGDPRLLIYIGNTLVLKLNPTFPRQLSLSLRVPYVTGVKDLDAITNTFCFFMTNASPAGCPTKSGEWFVGLQFRLNDRWMTQALFPIGSTSIYMRAINNGNKYNWIKLGAHQLSLDRISGKHDSRVQLKWVDPGKDPEHPSGLYAIIDGSMWCDLYLGR